MSGNALRELTVSAEQALAAIDDYNAKNDTAIVGPSLFRLGRAIAEGRAALKAIEATQRPLAAVPQFDLDRLAELVAFTNRHLASLPWSVTGDAGKPVIRGNKSGNLFYGYIATWQEADLLCLMVNSLPAMLAEIHKSRLAACFGECQSNPLDEAVNRT